MQFQASSRLVMMTASTPVRMSGLLSAAICALTLGQTASAIILPKLPPPPPVALACYFSFHLIDVYAYSPYAEVVFATTAGLAPAAAENLPESAVVSVVNGVATLASLTLYLQNPATHEYALLQSQGVTTEDLEFFQFGLQFGAGSMAPKSSWSAIVSSSAPIPLLANPAHGEFPQ